MKAGKLKLKDFPPGATPPAPPKAGPAKAPKPPRNRGADADEAGDDKVKVPKVKTHKVSFEVPADERIPVLALLNRRHYDWLAAVAKLEGRTPGEFLDRLVRLAWSRDPSKGGKFTDALGGDGRSKGSSGEGLTTHHPASGGTG